MASKAAHLSIRRTSSRWLALGLLYGALAVFTAHWLRALAPFPVADDFRIYYDALRTAARGGDPYQPYVIGKSFLYHPAALSAVSLIARGDFASARAAWTIASAFAWIGCIAAVWYIVSPTQRDIHWSADQVGAVAVLAVVGLCFGPAWETFYVGQVNTFVALALYASLLWADTRPRGAGLALAVAVVSKLSPVLFIPYFLVTGRPRVAVTALVGIAVATAIAAAQFSPAIVAQYLDIVPRLSAEVHETLYNQNALAIVVRALQRARHYDLVPAAALSFKALSLVCAGGVLFEAWRHPHGRAASTELFAVLVTAMVFFSPLVWYHHSTVLLLPIAVLLYQPHPPDRAVGVVALLLIQGDRAFEYFIASVPAPAVLGHGLLLGAGGLAYRDALRPARATGTERVATAAAGSVAAAIS